MAVGIGFCLIVAESQGSFKTTFCRDSRSRETSWWYHQDKQPKDRNLTWQKSFITGLKPNHCQKNTHSSHNPSEYRWQQTPSENTIVKLYTSPRFLVSDRNDPTTIGIWRAIPVDGCMKNTTIWFYDQIHKIWRSHTSHKNNTLLRPKKNKNIHCIK